MFMIKKIVLVLLACAMLLSLAGCSGKEDSPAKFTGTAAEPAADWPAA